MTPTETLSLILPFGVGLFVSPLVQWAKSKLLDFPVRWDLVSGALAILLAWGVVEFFGYAMTPEQIINAGLSAVGATSLLYGGAKQIGGKK